MDESQLRLLRFRRLTVGVFGALLAAVVAAASSSSRPPSLPVVGLFALMVLASENVSLKFPSRVTISPQVILVMAAIVALQGRGVVLGAAVIGSSGGLVLKAFQARRYSVIVFNVAQMALSAAAAAATYESLSHAGVSSGLKYPLVAISYVIVNCGLVLPAATMKSGRSLRDVWRDLRASLPNDFVFGILGLLVGDLYQRFGPIAVLTIIAPAIVARTVFDSVAGFRSAYHRLELLYGFTSELERNRHLPDALAAMLEQFRTLLDTSTAEITLLDDRGWRRTTLPKDSSLPRVEGGVGTPSEVAAASVGSLLPADVEADSELAAELVRRGHGQAILAPLRVDTRVIGAVIVADPADQRRFGSEDIRLLETLANHAAVSLQNDRLLDQLRYDSRHDVLTGLPNRARFNDLVAELPRPSAILLIDLDRFKEINDTLGHAHGDLLLKSVAQRISDELGHKAIVARLGGDEFGVLLPQTGSGDAVQAAVALLAAVEQPFHLDRLTLEITASVGIAVASGPDAIADRLLQEADVAMYAAKETHSGWEMYNPDRDHHNPVRLALAGEMRRAISSGEVEVHYQPKADLYTGAIKGVEALVRWRHPIYGLLLPDQFIPVAESAGLIRPLTLMVLAHAADQHRELREMGYDMGVAVNLSVRSVLDVNLPDQVAGVLAEHRMPPEALTLEITESSFMADPARTIGVLGRLATRGVCISIDDFGTGYSSLAYLKRLPAKEVKIDRSFVAGMLSNDADAAIVRSTVDLAHNLGLQAVAEGVENQETWDALAALGAEQAQGYFVSRALPADQLKSWLQRTHPPADSPRATDSYRPADAYPAPASSPATDAYRKGALRPASGPRPVRDPHG